MNQQGNLNSIIAGQLRPSVYDYDDYRKYLASIYAFKKNKNKYYSETAFIKDAGFANNSRGYLGLILKKKRNLGEKGLRGFINSIPLNNEEAIYFENLVRFNHAQDNSSKKTYLERMKSASKHVNNKLISIKESQYRLVSDWLLIALREIVALDDFKADTAWIKKQIRRDLKKTEIEQALNDLIQLNLIKRNLDGNFSQSEECIIFREDEETFKFSSDLHESFLDYAREQILHADYRDRSVQLNTISCNKDDFEAIKEEIRTFSHHLISKYGENKDNKKFDTVIQFGTQLTKVTK